MANLLGETVRRISIGREDIDDIKRALMESQKDHIAFRNGTLSSLRKRSSHLQSLLDRAYEDKLNGTITEELGRRKSQEWQTEMNDLHLRPKALESAAIDVTETRSSRR